MGREKRARLKGGRRIPEELVIAHITTKRPIREEAKMLQQTTDATLTTTTKESA
jgi:hypothetical protein